MDTEHENENDLIDEPKKSNTIICININKSYSMRYIRRPRPIAYDSEVPNDTLLKRIIS